MHWPPLHLTVTPLALHEQLDARAAMAKSAEGLEEEMAMGEAATKVAARRMRKRVACILAEVGSKCLFFFFGESR